MNPNQKEFKIAPVIHRKRPQHWIVPDPVPPPPVHTLDQVKLETSPLRPAHLDLQWDRMTPKPRQIRISFPSKASPSEVIEALKQAILDVEQEFD